MPTSPDISRTLNFSMGKAYHSKDAESNETSWAFRSQRRMKYHLPHTPSVISKTDLPSREGRFLIPCGLCRRVIHLKFIITGRIV
ncbi:MAG: hypothetical protein Q8P40_09370, partial [Nitrospirota bacterium]|nr:hypothetical protein [Nitrospirota bacterium]